MVYSDRAYFDDLDAIAEEMLRSTVCTLVEKGLSASEVDRVAANELRLNFEWEGGVRSTNADAEKHATDYFDERLEQLGYALDETGTVFPTTEFAARLYNKANDARSALEGSSN